MKLLWLWILLGVLVGIAFIPIRFRCRGELNTQNPTDVGMPFALILYILFIPITLFPQKVRLPNLKKFSYRAIKKTREKRKAEQLRKKRKDGKKAKKQGIRKAKKKKTEPPKKTIRSKVKQVTHLLRLFVALLKLLLAKFGKYLVITVKKFDVHIVGDDPQDTAVTYGAVLAIAEGVWGAIGDTPPLRKVKKSSIAFYADFSQTAPSASIDVSFRILVWQIVAIAIGALGVYLRENKKNKMEESSQEKQNREMAEASARAEVLRELKQK